MTARKATAATDVQETPDAPPEPADAAPTGATPIEPDHEWPSEGGCYVRQPDGSLKRED